jgi:hypothetical protein
MGKSADGLLLFPVNNGRAFFLQTNMPRWLLPLLALILGISLGLVYGWVISPVQYVDTTPDTLRADYRADYVLTVAEAYQSEKDGDLAVRRLAILGSQPPAEIAAQALEQARSLGYAESDLSLIQKLITVLQARQPASQGIKP